MDLTPVFNQVLAGHDSVLVKPREFRIRELDEFLKEAYRIVGHVANRQNGNLRQLTWTQRSHIVELHSYLRSIRQSYLSIAQPPRRKQVARNNTGSSVLRKDGDKHLTDKERAEIDANSKQLLRELNHAVKSLSDAEQLRQEADRTIAFKKRAKQGFGAIGRWAAGGAITAKSPEEEAEEAKANTIKVHRESIIWYLQRQLEQCSRAQSSMMEIRLMREVEKSKSVLYKARGTLPVSDEYFGSNGGAPTPNGFRGKSTAQQDTESKAVEAELDPDQLQLFAQENQDMLKHYEDTLDQVRYVLSFKVRIILITILGLRRSHY